MTEEVVQEVDKEEAKGWRLEVIVAEETKVAMMVGGVRSRGSQMVTQRAVRMIAHGEVKGGRSHGGQLAGDTRGIPDRHEAIGSGIDGEQMGPSDTEGFGDQGRAAATSIRGGA